MICFVCSNCSEDGLIDQIDKIKDIGLKESEYKIFGVRNTSTHLKEVDNVVWVTGVEEVLQYKYSKEDICFFMNEGDYLELTKEICNRILLYSRLENIVLLNAATDKCTDEIVTSDYGFELLFEGLTFPVFKMSELQDKKEYFAGGTFQEMRILLASILCLEKEYVPLLYMGLRIEYITHRDKVLYLDSFGKIGKSWIERMTKLSGEFSTKMQTYLMGLIIKRFQENKNKLMECRELSDPKFRNGFFENSHLLMQSIKDEVICSFLDSQFPHISKQEAAMLLDIKNGNMSPSARYEVLSLPKNLVLTINNHEVGTINKEVVQIDNTAWDEKYRNMLLKVSTNGVFEQYGAQVKAEVAGVFLKSHSYDGKNVTYFQKKISTRKNYCFEIPRELLEKDLNIDFYMEYKGKKYKLNCLMKYYVNNKIKLFANGNTLCFEKKEMVQKVIRFDGNIDELKRSLDYLKNDGELRDVCINFVGDEKQKTEIYRLLSEYDEQENVVVCDEKEYIKKLCNEKSSYPYVVFIHNGAFFTSNYFSKAVTFMKKHDLNLSLPMEVVNRDKENEISECSEEDFVVDVLERPRIFKNGAAVIYSKSIFERVGEKWINYFTENANHNETELAYLLMALKNERRIGAVGGSKCFTPVNYEKDGALFTLSTKFDYYIPSLDRFFRSICEFYDEDLPYLVQANLLHHLNWRFSFNENQKNTHAISDERLEEWNHKVKSILNYISNEVISGYTPVSGLKIKPHVKLYYMWLKDNSTYNCNLVQNNKTVSFLCDGYEIVGLNKEKGNIELVNYEEKKLIIDFSTRGFFELLGLFPKAEYNGEQIEIHPTYYFSHRKFFGKSFFKRYTFCVELDMCKLGEGELKLFYEYEGTRYNISFSSNRYTAKISSNVPGSYWHFGEFIMSYNKKINTIQFKEYSQKRMEDMEKTLCKRCTTEIDFKRKEIAERGLELRKKYFETREQYKGKHIWLTYDKLYKGGDCGEYMFKYLVNNAPEVDARYVVNEDAPDYERLINEGYTVLKYGSDEHLLDYLNAEVVFNTHGGIHAFNGLDNELVQFVSDLICHDAFTIQHGLTVQELAFNAHRRFNNIRGYFCASKYEVENLSRDIYGYEDKKILKLTGIPRYDGLVNQDKKQILITPTWRNYIAMPATAKNEQKGYYEGFKKTEYFKIYNKVLSDERLIETAKRCGYKLIYLLHPVVSAQISDYDVCEEVEVIQASTVDYEKILKESSLMVTDYSGIQFDFAYMRKPVVYYHHPSIPPHYKESGFSYEKMAFGEICTKHEELVETLCQYMEKSCVLKKKYQERQDDFFAYDDLNTCKRIYEVVKEYKKI